MALEELLQSVGTARNRYIQYVQQLTEEQAQWKPDPETWSAVENTEHLYWAEHGGIWGMWKILQAKRDGKPPVYAGELIHRGLSIEEIIARTWQPKEKVPPIAAPRMGGSVAFWLAALESLQQPLTKLNQELADEDFEAIIHPHPISGPLDIGQRFEFLRFHIDRHRNQVTNLREMLTV